MLYLFFFVCTASQLLDRSRIKKNLHNFEVEHSKQQYVIRNVEDGFETKKMDTLTWKSDESSLRAINNKHFKTAEFVSLSFQFSYAYHETFRFYSGPIFV